MKEQLKEYKEHIESLLKNKYFTIILLITTILSFGFAITHESIGVDDIAFDKYVTGTWILSAGRWGTWLLYNILHITEFTPFWLDFITTLVMVCIAIFICAFFKKNLKKDIGIVPYIIFSNIFISYPLICHSFIYQSTNLVINVSSLIMILAISMVYENFYHIKSKKNYLIIIAIMPFAISMYESCCQTYMVFLMMIAFMEIIKGKGNIKEILKFILVAILVLLFALIFNVILCVIVNLILSLLGIKVECGADKNIPWIHNNVNEIGEKINYLRAFSLQQITTYFPMAIFAMSTAIIILVELINLWKKNTVYRFLCAMAIIVLNFCFVFLQLNLTYRLNFSWGITVAFALSYLYLNCINKRVLKNIISVILILIVMYQTKYLNQMFYMEYLKYKKEEAIAFEIASYISTNCTDISKPIVGIMNNKKEYFRVNADIGREVIAWGIYSFNEPNTKFVDFINHFGYRFRTS